MFAKTIPESALSRAGYLLALGFPGPALTLFGEVPCQEHGTCAYRCLELRLLKASGRWEEGLIRVGSVGKEDKPKLRRAAARFLVGYSVAKLAPQNAEEAAQLVTTAGELWPEGHIDALSLGMDHRPHPAGLLPMETVHPPSGPRWDGRHPLSSGRMWEWRSLLPRRSRPRVRYRFIRREGYQIRWKRLVQPKITWTLNSLATLAAEIRAKFRKSPLIIRVGLTLAPPFVSVREAKAQAISLLPPPKI